MRLRTVHTHPHWLTRHEHAPTATDALLFSTKYVCTQPSRMSTTSAGMTNCLAITPVKYLGVSMGVTPGSSRPAVCRSLVTRAGSRETSQHTILVVAGDLVYLGSFDRSTELSSSADHVGLDGPLLVQPSEQFVDRDGIPDRCVAVVLADRQVVVCRLSSSFDLVASVLAHRHIDCRRIADEVGRSQHE